MADSDDSFPWRQLGVLAICRLAEPIAFVSIVAYAFVMVQDINGEKDASFYAGLLVSAFALAEACTAMFWGHLSDRYGRKPIILVALGGTALSSLLFGFAKTYWVALLARVVGGLLNGNVAVMQTMVAEMVKKPEHEPRAYALQPFMWSLGSIAGSALGGFTAQPARFHPGLFSQDGIFGQFPYLLPNLISVAVILVAMILGYLFLEETNPALASRESTTERLDANQTADETTPLRRGRRESSMSTATADARSQGVPYLAVSAPIPNEPEFDLRRSSFASIASLTAFKKSHSVSETHEATVLEEDEPSVSTKGSVKTFNKNVITWMMALILMCYHQMAFSSLLPVYLLDDPRRESRQLDLIGGLGQTLPQVGTFLAINSVISLVIQGVIFPLYVGKLGVWWTVVSLTICSPFVYLVAPLITLLPNPNVGVYIIMTLQSLSTTMIYPILLILLKNATPSPLVLGKVNGLAMSGCSGARTIAPPLVGIIYSALGSAAAWWSAAIIAVVALIELCFSRRPRDSEEEVLRRASTSGRQA